MTPITNKMTTEQLLADLHTGQTKIASAAESYQAALTEKQAAFKSFQANPAAVPVSEAVRIISELNGLQELTETFTPQLVDFIQRQLADQTFISRKDEFVLAATADLTAVLERQPGFVEKIKAGLVAKITQAWDRATRREDRDMLLADRDAQEAKLEVLETNIGYAKAAVARFATTPTPEHFGEVRSAISFVKSALA